MKTSTGTSRSLPNLPPNSRYELLFKLASGGMASVYVGRIRGAGGFWRLVAIKKAHAHLIEDPSFRRMLVEEARLASRIHHPNVVAVLDVEQAEDSLLLVMDYIEGASLADVMATKEPLPARLGVRIALDACAGLHAAHTLTDPSGKPLQIVHRDVSPQNLLVGVDGVSRVTDFGIAKSTQHASTTTTGALKGKLAYMAPEYVDGKAPDQRSDVFGLGVVIWEALANRRLFRGENEVDTLKRIVNADAPLLSSVAPHIGTHLDPVLSAALAKDPSERFATAKALGTALEIAAGRADLIGSAEEVGAFVQKLFIEPLSERRRFIQEHVASDVGPASGRPTMPDRRDGVSKPESNGGGPSQTDPNEVAHAQTNLAANAKSEAEKTRSPKGRNVEIQGEDNSSHPSSTLDGSGVSRPSRTPTSSSIPTHSRRAIWVIGALVATGVGAAAAVGFVRLQAPPRESPTPDSSNLPTSITPIQVAPTASGSPANKTDVSPAGAPSVSPQSTASARASAAPSTSVSSVPSTARSATPAKKTSATASPSPPADVLPNPYGAK